MYRTYSYDKNVAEDFINLGIFQKFGISIQDYYGLSPFSKETLLTTARASLIDSQASQVNHTALLESCNECKKMFLASLDHPQNNDGSSCCPHCMARKLKEYDLVKDKLNLMKDKLTIQLQVEKTADACMHKNTATDWMGAASGKNWHCKDCKASSSAKIENSVELGQPLMRYGVANKNSTDSTEVDPKAKFVLWSDMIEIFENLLK